MADKKTTRFALLSVTGAVLVAGCLVFGNILSHYVYERFDFSQGHVYSLSPASKHLLGELKDPVLITCYFSPSLPPQYAEVRDYLESLLHEYSVYSGGKVRYTFYTADDPNVFSQKAQDEGVEPVRFNILEKERYEVREAYLGLVLRHLDKKDVVPFVSDTTGLEYDLSSRIKKLVFPTRKVLAWVSSNGALQLDDLPQDARQHLEQDYDVRPTDLDQVSSDTFQSLDAFLLLGPTQRLDDRAVYVLDQALLAGKPVGVALDSKQVDLRSFMGAPNETGLDGWLLHVGLPVRQNIVLDAQNQKVPIQSQQGGFAMTIIVDYAPFLVSTDLDQGSPLTKGLDSLALPYVAPIDVSTAAAGGPAITVLARSSSNSWLNPAWDRQYAAVSPFANQEPGPNDARGPFVLAAVSEGHFKSYFPAPPKAPDAEQPAKGKRAKKSGSSADPLGPMLSESQAPGRVVVIGTSHFASQDYPNPPADQAFFLNLVDWLEQDQDLIGIRAKTVAFRPLREIPAGWKTTVRYADMLGGPLCIVLLGVGGWRRRAAKTAARALFYRPGGRPV